MSINVCTWAGVCVYIWGVNRGDVDGGMDGGVWAGECGQGVHSPHTPPRQPVKRVVCIPVECIFNYIYLINTYL